MKENGSNLNKKLGLWAFVFLICAVGYYYLYYMTSKEAEDLNKLQGEVAAKMERANYLSNLRKKLEMYRGERGRIEGYFLNKKTVADFLGLMEGVGKTVGVDVKISSVSIEEKDGVAQLVINFQGAGAFDSIYKFTGALNNLPANLETKTFSVVYNSTLKNWNASYSVVVKSFTK